MVFGMSGVANFVLTNSTNTSTAEIIYEVFQQKWIHGSSGFTTFVSTAAVLVIAVLALCVFLCVRRSRNKNESKIPFTIEGISTTSNSLFEHNPIGRVQKSSMSSNKKIQQHKNIITPDRHIAFVIPTIPLHAQDDVKESKQSEIASPSHLAKVPMIEKQYYPQFHTEDTTLPKISFCLFYEVSSQVLFVKILGGCNFPEDDGRTYGVQVKLYPGRGSKQKTKDYPGGNPIFNQEFRFTVRKQVLQTKVLKLRVIGLAGASSTPKTLLGVVNLAMKDLPAVNHEDVLQDFRTGPLWRKVELPSSIGHGVRLEISLKWTLDPSPGLLILKIREAYGLHDITEAEYTSTYVKVTLHEHGRTIKSRKTKLLRWGSLPNYDDTFVVTIPFDLLSQISFTLTLVARGRLGSKAILGRMNLGPVTFVNPQTGLSTGTEIWEDMCHQPNTEICRWLELFP